MRWLLVVALVVTGCSSGEGSGSRSASGGHAQRALLVFAASSLTKAFPAEGRAFEAEHPGVHVTFSFAGSQALVAQIRQGAPADVLATADLTTMSRSGLADSRVFARNSLAILTRSGNPDHINRLADLSRNGLRVVLAGPTVPVGKAARKALAAAGVTVRPVSLEQDVAGVVRKVALGEADAGIGYVTDLKSAGTSLSGTPLPGISNSYPIAVAKPGPDAAAFVSFLLGAHGQAVLSSFGFLPPG
jgi:molybdate transport system substrate-binding protein